MKNDAALRAHHVRSLPVSAAVRAASRLLTGRSRCARSAGQLRPLAWLPSHRGLMIARRKWGRCLTAYWPSS